MLQHICHISHTYICETDLPREILPEKMEKRKKKCYPTRESHLQGRSSISRYNDDIRSTTLGTLDMFTKCCRSLHNLSALPHSIQGVVVVVVNPIDPPQVFSLHSQLTIHPYCVVKVL